MRRHVDKSSWKPYTNHSKEDAILSDIDDSTMVQNAPDGTPTGGGLLVVIVHEAEDIEGKNHTNPHVQLLFRGEEKKNKGLLHPKVHFAMVLLSFSFYGLITMALNLPLHV
ncbi:hypothetical protein V6N12_073578 [Hibiscus sabdariffa]|uniref:Uncharacterized protein n=1 Tax=Hibiscus sabdariffa TaxID=183260 RepID=A0ABR2BHJ2_9ROSI